MTRNPEVDAWFAATRQPHEPAMQRVRDIVLKTDPRISESIKWKTPTFAFEGNIASFTPAKKLVSLMVHRGSELSGKHPRLEGDGPLVRTMRFQSLDDVNLARNDIEKAVRAWIALREVDGRKSSKKSGA